MIDKKTASRQLIRLSILRGFPADGTPAQTELLQCLQQASENPDHCARMVDAWIKTSPFSPTPAELYTLSDTVPIMQMTERPDKRCKACSGTGYEHVWRLTTYASNDVFSHRSEQILSDEQAAELRARIDGKTQRIDSCVRRCLSCAYGKQLAATEAA